MCCCRGQVRLRQWLSLPPTAAIIAQVLITPLIAAHAHQSLRSLVKYHDLLIP
jgi:hypothetical protein